MDHLGEVPERAYQAACEIWEKQGEKKTPEFVQVIFNRVILPGIEGRRNGIWSTFEAYAVAAGMRESDNTFYRAGRLRLETAVRDLCTEWRVKAKEEIWELGYKQKIPNRGITGGAMTNSETWHGFHDEFIKLDREEIALLQNTREKQYMHASGDYNAAEMPGDDGHYQTYGHWELHYGPNGYFQEQFEVLGTKAGVALGSSPGIRPLDFWLHSLFLFLEENRNRHPHQIIGDTVKAGLIENVWGNSATFCSRLEKEALEKSAAPMNSASVANDGGSGNRKGYKAEVRQWMKRKKVETVDDAAAHLGVSVDVLKSIMSDKGKPRYGKETLESVLKKIGYKKA